jgi:hypothetical protein
LNFPPTSRSSSYRAATPLVEFTPEAFIEPLRVGAELPEMPVWPGTDLYINLPLERTYREDSR